jgi:hypothetical protein
MILRDMNIYLSQPLILLLELLLQIDYRERPSIEEIRGHEWINMDITKNIVI